MKPNITIICFFRLCVSKLNLQNWIFSGTNITIKRVSFVSKSENEKKPAVVLYQVNNVNKLNVQNWIFSCRTSISGISWSLSISRAILFVFSSVYASVRQLRFCPSVCASVRQSSRLYRYCVQTLHVFVYIFV